MPELTPTSQTHKQAWRIIDVNLNRAAEGLRTIEEFARLVKHDALVAKWLKEIRHQLTGVLEPTCRTARLSARSAETDAGTGLTTENESLRPNPSDIVSAAAERVTQALRCLEEYSKIVSPPASSRFKELRYQAYDLLAKAELRLAAGDQCSAARLYLLIDCTQSIDQFTTYLRALTGAGVDWFQLRDKQADGNQLVKYATAAVDALAGSSASLIVNDRVDVALASGAAGVHVGEQDISLDDARRLCGTALRIGVSTHTLEQAVAAEQGGADYIGCGPMFQSSTKNFGEFPGPAFLEAVVKNISIPMFAIGGIDRSNVQHVINTGCQRIAVSHAIHSAEDPIAAAKELKDALLVAN